MALKRGRGLFIGKEDFIPLERVDIIEDLKRVVDVHRLTDFSLHDKIVPTIELRRTEDELVLAATITVAALAANFSMVQIFNTTTDKVLRPISVYASNSAGPQVDYLFATAAFAAQQVGQAVDRRKAAGPFVINSSTVGVFAQQQAVAEPGALFWSQFRGAGVGDFLPDSLLRTMALPPGTGLTISGGAVNQTVLVAMAYRVDFLQSTRPAGL